MMMLGNAGWHVCAPLVSGWPRLPAAERLVSRHSPASGVTLPHPPQSVSVLSPSHRPYPEIIEKQQVNWWQFVNNNCDNSAWSVLEDDLWGSRHQFKHSLLVKYFTVNLVVLIKNHKVNGNFLLLDIWMSHKKRHLLPRKAKGNKSAEPRPQHWAQGFSCYE